ncbi:uncharacterized protein SOCE26_019370 [Sorangium cellulosum]|uniref:Uncharacterized protein n=1 Tax=Sorangium cellulosum TaxID=56 RepID=A0A2L0EML6_SORCE|nr:hypothetical protein [Sorangium cellulosum]AUX40536.1 uncharacterized protein SOCE26_019370 [Sorangium cellulosum]
MGTMAPSAETMKAQLERAAKLDDCKRINDVKGCPEVAQSKLDNSRAAGRVKWDGIKAGVESVRTRLNFAFTDLTRRTAATYSRWMNPSGK